MPVPSLKVLPLTSLWALVYLLYFTGSPYDEGMKVSVDFPEVMRNAAKEGIDLQKIAIKYENLTSDEVKMLESHQMVTNRLPGGGLLAKFPKDGEPLFQDKATAVLYLGA